MSRAVALCLLAALFLLSFAAGWIGDLLSLDSGTAALGDRFLPPSARHFLGTDELGRDVFLRLLEGGRVSLSVALSAALVSVLLGTASGICAGYFGGLADALLMRLADFLLALPALPLLIILSAIDMDKIGLGFMADDPRLGIYKLVCLISLFGWTGTARLARARTMTVKASDYVRAARALGVSHARIMLRHVLPGVSDTVAVAAALSVGGFILTESALSFLGLGVQPPTASWGSMLSNAGENIFDHPELALWPGVMIFLTVLSFNALSDTFSNRRA